MKEIKYENFVVFFERKRGSSLRLKIDRNGRIKLTAPFLCSEKRAKTFLEEHLDWICEKMSQRSAPRQFKPGDCVVLLGKNLQIVSLPNAKRGVFVEGERLFVSGDPVFLHRRVCDFIKKVFYAHIQERALFYASQINEKPTQISLKNTVSRWGSCSSAKRLNFCWKLALAPLFVSDYIAAHEVAHLKQMNHGPAFWALVAALKVERAEAEIWLRRHGNELLAIK